MTNPTMSQAEDRASTTPVVHGRPLHIMVVYGTRPEAVKMAPLIQALRLHPGFVTSVVVTGQHREMLDQVNEVFDITPDLDLDIHQTGQSLTDVTVRCLMGVEGVLGAGRPDAIVVQGDTTTAFAASLAGFYQQIPVVHLEAGLRTNHTYNPFPEEINRRLTAQLASLHLAPTWESRRNLVAENVDEKSIIVTGNTVIDALHWTVNRRPSYGDDALESELEQNTRPVVLVTAHRRESWGAPLREAGRAIARLARHYDDHLIVFPLHRNPIVRSTVVPTLRGITNVRITEPLPYGGFCRLMNRASLILTDSGGVQEEGPSLGKPVLVLRETTERPEAVHAGTVKLVGTNEDAIFSAVSQLIDDPGAYARMANAVNPYGDGRAAQRCVQSLAHLFGRAACPEQFSGGRIDGRHLEQIDDPPASFAPAPG